MTPTTSTAGPGGKPTVGDVVDALDRAYPPKLAESWDSVGLVCGDPADAVERVLVCIDVTDDVVRAALDAGVQMIVAHHPLLLRGVDTVAASTPKGSLIHRLIRGGCALFTAHTNADSANPGVSDALARLLGVDDLKPLQPLPTEALDKWVVMVPDVDAAAVTEAMFAAGAGALGDYRACSWSVGGVGQFEPQAGANPHIGTVGARETVVEQRVEMVAARHLRSAVRAALRAAHPYEEPAFDVFESVALPGDVGLGRVGSLPAPTTLRDFVDLVAQRLPGGGAGIRGAGQPDSTVHVVAVCGGAGDSLLGAARACGADVYVTADLRHHVVDEHLRVGGPSLIDAGHWATEFPWCAQAAEVVRAVGVRAEVFDVPTDPFTVTGSGR
ncbi:Nif3-like dinuclear metal center hexameric protein [Gordonia sp. TBRC 11910]|uniref:GTP cyclohydrolase 1 type 2 homolog n=1 Tax=Gordonia asplenii TaxID=2725283 RepID=A0A848KT73_9ACTN|nr:Nif3-like dinuclear metal center hexameric protein [Gordonia asplenii]NMO01197.1 Nif3-like dinuclear metal center hexameric protein [Gordonia asplenii]